MNRTILRNDVVLELESARLVHVATLIRGWHIVEEVAQRYAAQFMFATLKAAHDHKSNDHSTT